MADESVQQAGKTIKRRGFLAGAAALVAGIAAKQGSAPVAATSGGGDQGFLALGSNPWYIAGTSAPNTPAISAAPTVIQASPNFGNFTGTNGGHKVLLEVDASTNTTPGRTIVGIHAVGYYDGDGVDGHSDHGIGVFGDSNNVGVKGIGANTGVYGKGTSTSGTGVYGTCTGSTSAYGVWGETGQGYGVVGSSASGTGVYGSSSNLTGVQGYSSSGTGVLGQSDATAASIGVKGISNLGFGLYGSSNGGPGVFGTTTAAQNAGLAGVVSTPGTAAFAGTATVPTAFAGFFTGDVIVNGNFTVVDPTKKHGAIAHPDGSHRILYSMESPESWLEDFGKGQLVNGRADVALDPDFAAVVHIEEYLVFLTPRDAACKGLAVTGQNQGGFVVQELSGGTSSTAFNWRVVAKPKSENKATRMAKFTIPTITVPEPENVSPPPRPAKTPDTQPQPAPPPRAGQPAVSTSPAPQPAVSAPPTAQPGGGAPTVQPIPSPRSG